MLGVMAVVVVVPAFARLNSEHVTVAVQDEEAKNALYAEVTKNITTHQDVAYQAAKEYLQKWPTDDDQIAKYLKDFVAKYEKAMVKQNCTKLLGEKKWAEAFPICKQVVNEQPDDLASSLNLSWAGLQLGLSGNFGNSADATGAAMTTIQSIEAGKVLEAGKPYADKDKQEALGWLNYSLGLYNEKSGKPAEAAASFIKSAGYESSIKTNPATYTKLASVYESEYGRLQESYDAKFKGQTETDESKAALLQVKQFLDPMIDAYARAVAYSGDTPTYQQIKTAAKQRLTELYKFAKGSEDGIDALIASVKTKPIPPHPSAAVSTPVTPASTNAAVTTGNSPAAGPKTSTNTEASTAGPVTNTPATQSTMQGGTPDKKPMTAPAGNNGRRPRRR